MKTIILTASTGHGHVSAANSICELLKSHQLDCEVVDALSFLGKDVSKLISKTLVNIAVKTPGIFGFMYKSGDALSSEDRKSPVYYANSLYADKLRQHIINKGYDTAVCTHLFPAEALTYLRHKKEFCFDSLGNGKTVD